ncbi:unnamed protein product [Linum tenue]|uniref:Uncharacterized protein n=1 Tax=Linum tenue TaxID=586396 RepID=A0AAV0IV14_9ROSI|nr:unnamed protein product [Linum tenue]
MSWSRCDLKSGRAMMLLGNSGFRFLMSSSLCSASIAGGWGTWSEIVYILTQLAMSDTARKWQQQKSISPQ